MTSCSIFLDLVVIDFYLYLKYLLILMKKMIYILLIFLFSSLVTYQSNAIENNTCAKALGLEKELRDFYIAKNNFVTFPSKSHYYRMAIFYGVLEDRSKKSIKNKNTDLHKAASSGDVSEIRRLVSDDGIKVDIRGPKGVTPLGIAAAYGQKDAIDVLLELGADINASDAVGNSPLHYAVMSGHAHIVEHLLDKDGIDIDQTDIIGEFAAMFAVKYGYPEIFRILAFHKADLMRTNTEGRTFLHEAIMSPNIKDRASMIETILETVPAWPEPGIINWPEPIHGNSPLHLVALEGYVDVVDVLLQRGASLTSINEDGELPIHVAARSNQEDVFLELKDANPDLLNARDDKGQTPRDTAKEHNSQDVLFALDL